MAANLRRLRREVSTYELSRRLAALGRPIASSGITRIELGDRRVDVDDLLALAVALGVSPNQLLLPVLPADAVAVVGTVAAMGADVWAWAAGECPLVILGTDGQRVAEPSGQEVAAFAVAAMPHRFAAGIAGR